jgi:hypothetical protein
LNTILPYLSRSSLRFSQQEVIDADREAAITRDDVLGFPTTARIVLPLLSQLSYVCLETYISI